MAKRQIALSRVAEDALRTLGTQIRIARHRKGWTAADLGARIGVSPRTVTAIEAGTPGSAVGSVLNAAVMTGVPLFTPDPAELRRERRHAGDVLALIPSRTVGPRAGDDPDDFNF